MSTRRVNRREFVAGLGGGLTFARQAYAAAPLTINFRKLPPYESVLKLVEPGSDEFPGEKLAIEVESRLRNLVHSGALPLDPSCKGASPAPTAYEEIATGVSRALFGGKESIAAGFEKWKGSLGEIRVARFYSLPGNIVRYDIRGTNNGRLEHRVGHWKQMWTDGRITSFEPVDETLIHSAKPWFREITGYAYEGEPSFKEQLLRGVPYWRARLDPSCGIDVYGENGIAVADIDGDGLDEIYVSQPGGLPNRLYKNDGNGRLRDISKQAGLDILDDTASALFVDLRNSGFQDLVLIRSNLPMLFLNDGKGHFTELPDAFRFATRPQGSFTSVAAADFDGDGRLDLYLCCYVYFQSEAQYRYPVPYHDAQNGPPNFLFRNRLNESPGYFEDVTAATGIDHNNNRFSFAATWCDYNGDGWPDLYVTNDFGRKNLYRNTAGRFSDVAEEAGVVDLGPGMSAAWLDYDGDGHPDLLVSNMWSSCGQRIVSDPAFGPALKDPSLRAKYQSHVKGNSLYRNNGNGTFTYTGNSEGIEICPWSWSCDATDLDNDGTPELYIACGMITNSSQSDLMSYFYRQVVSKSPVRQMLAPDYENGWNAINQLIRQDYSWAGPEPNVFFARRAGRFYDFSGVSGLDRADDSRAFAFTDIDGDGNLDVVLKSRLGPQVRVFQNDCGAASNRLVISLRGTKSNRDAIGARVEAAGQVKWLAAGSGYLSQHTKRIHFGLGEKQQAESVRVRWPSGFIQELPPLKAGFLHEITEGNDSIRSTPLRARRLLPDTNNYSPDNDARLHTTWFREPVPLPEKRNGPALLIVHAGESFPKLDAPTQSLDLSQAPPDLVAAYAIFRRYLFDYRTDLVTPLWLLIDSGGRVRKIYAACPDSSTVLADIRTIDAPVPDERGLPLKGRFIGSPRRDYYKFGGALLMAGYSEQALPYLEEMLKRTPDNPRALLAVARIHMEAKRLQSARHAVEHALSVDPRLPEGWNELGGLESFEGRTAEALRCFEKALALAPDLPYALMNAAQAQEKLGNTTEAERLFRHLLTIDPKNGDAANGLGLILAKRGQNAEARKLFESAISIRRDDSSAINNLGVLFMNIGRPDDAIAAFRYGLEVAPDDEKLYLNLARIYIQGGQRERARQVMQQLLDRKPGNALALRALKELDLQ